MKKIDFNNSTPQEILDGFSACSKVTPQLIGIFKNTTRNKNSKEFYSLVRDMLRYDLLDIFYNIGGIAYSPNSDISYIITAKAKTIGLVKSVRGDRIKYHLNSSAQHGAEVYNAQLTHYIAGYKKPITNLRYL
jgi:hypothetical protein